MAHSWWLVAKSRLVIFIPEIVYKFKGTVLEAYNSGLREG